jgi:predicted hydrocarbon binding protein
LRVERQGADRVLIHYESPRQWCALGKGLIHGIAVHYGDRVTIAEESCMLRGQPSCQLLVTLSPA